MCLLIVVVEELSLVHQSLVLLKDDATLVLH
jgi:hypothetical protein